MIGTARDNAVQAGLPPQYPIDEFGDEAAIFRAQRGFTSEMFGERVFLEPAPAHLFEDVQGRFAGG